MDNTDLINLLNNVIIDLQDTVNNTQDTLNQLEADGVPGIDVEDDVKLGVLRILANASSRIA